MGFDNRTEPLREGGGGLRAALRKKEGEQFGSAPIEVKRRSKWRSKRGSMRSNCRI
jgi:hypothetical protein